ncbi:MAG: hypothetical protein SGILL_002627 [Bacillariaceae sp.]
MPDRELKILEAMVSKPEYISVQFDPQRMAAPDLTLLVETRPSHAVRQWSQEGPLYLPPDSEQNYVLTLCTALHGEVEKGKEAETYLEEMIKWIDTGNQSQKLGFVQIRTDTETLFIELEHSDDVPILSLSSASNRTEQSNGGRIEKLELPDTTAGDVGTKNGAATTSLLLKSFPDSFDFNLISTSIAPMHAHIGLQNLSPVPIRVMRVTAAIEAGGNEMAKQEVDSLGLKVKIATLSTDHVVELGKGFEPLVLPSATYVDKALTMSCTVDPDPSVIDSGKQVFDFNGTLIVRGTMETGLSYQEWLEGTLENPYRDEHLTVEIPFSVSLRNGRIEALIKGSSHPYPQLFAARPWDITGRAISHLFFPLNPYAAVPGSEDALPPQNFIGANEIRHDLSILSNLLSPLSLIGSEVVDVETPNDPESLCHRFNVTMTRSRDDAQSYHGFDEIGTVVLKYHFGPSRQQTSRPDLEAHASKRCKLKIQTTPKSSGGLNVPLLIYPGRLEVSLEDMQSEQKDIEANPVHATTIVGLADLLVWCRSTSLGGAFLNILSAKLGKKSKSGARLLSTYIKGLLPHGTSIPKPNFHPILLKLGAIDHGEVAKTSLYLVNHNPIPVTVSIDVGEVEGSVIYLSREENLRRSHTVLNYLPDPDTNIIVTKGEYKDHPVDGLLTFLLSNDEALNYVSRFSFRESVSAHEPAIAGSDVLGSLYGWHSKATFHRTANDLSNLDPTSDCPGEVYPSEYDMDKQSHDISLSNPSGSGMIITSDQALTKSLVDCDARNTSLPHAKGIKIPPGAKAGFQVLVRAPPKASLKEDISELLTTGLVVSTNLGDVMPIFSTFEALQGQLEAQGVQPLPMKEGGVEIGPANILYGNESVIDVPLQLSWNSKTATDIDPWDESEPIEMLPDNQESGGIFETASSLLADFVTDDKNGIPLFLKSSFSRPVRLLKLESCNPWFKVIPVNETSQRRYSSSGGVHVGYLQSDVTCSNKDSDVYTLPSYYQCFFNWMDTRHTVQPEGCGLSILQEPVLNSKRMEAGRTTLAHGLHELRKIFHKNSSNVDFNCSFDKSGASYAKTGHVRNDGSVPGLEHYLNLQNALYVATKYGFIWLTSSVRATLEYDATPSSGRDGKGAASKQNLTLSVRDLAIKSVLKPPKLFRSKEPKDDVLQFEPTIVGEVSRAFIPMHNPTAVPLRVRLGVVSAWEIKDKLLQEKDPNVSVENPNYVVPDPSPYVQSGKFAAPGNETVRHFWWEGGGSFFIHDRFGDLIRCRHNITIRAGPGAIVSLVNPSLHAQVGLLAGCGARCGIRDGKTHTIDLNVAKSPLGASAAAGITLTGNLRTTSAQANSVAGAEPILLSGGIPVPGTGGPPAFAIPYSALDEIVIPPFGNGRLGPIYFRPSGLYRAVGCDLAKKSGAKPVGFSIDLCRSQTFKSFLYLENSLTGLERINLRGRATWDRVAFMDPTHDSNGGDAFGDIEIRNGRPTLLFFDPGPPQEKSAAARAPFRGPVVKETLIHNLGDRTVQIMSVGLSEVSRSSKSIGSGSCSLGTFRLQECFDDEQRNGSNINGGFFLLPGENRSVVIEQFPDCSRSEEFVDLLVKYRGFNGNNSTFGHMMNSRFNRHATPFQVKQEVLLLGYQVDDSAFFSVSPLVLTNNNLPLTSMTRNTKDGNDTKLASTFPMGSRDKTNRLLTVQVCLVLSALLLLCFTIRTRFYAMRGMLQKIPTYMAYGQPTGVASTRSRSHWNAAFRCLARADPSSTELQSLSREQMRQIMLGMYNAKGSTPPAAMSSAATFSRERRALVSNSSRSRTGKDGGGANERIRTLSDAIFHDTHIANGHSIRNNFPAGLGWRVAFSRGILRENSADSITLELQTRDFLRKRGSIAQFRKSHQSEAAEVPDLDDDDDDQQGFKSTANRNGTQKHRDRQKSKDTREGENPEALSVVSTSELEGNKADTKSDWIEAGSKTNESKASRKQDQTAKNQRGKQSGKALPDQSKRLGVKSSQSPRDVGQVPIATQSLSKTKEKSNSTENVDDNATVTTPVRHKQKDKTNRERKSPNGAASNRKAKSKNAQTDPMATTEDKPKKNARDMAGKGNSKKEKANGSVKDKHRRDAEDEARDKKLPERELIRPPPGLAPPPGFGGSAGVEQNTASATDRINAEELLNNPPSIQDILGSQANIQIDPLPGPTSLPFAATNTSGSMIFSSVSSDIGGTENHLSFVSSPSPSSSATPATSIPPMSGNVGLGGSMEQQPSLPVLNEESQNGFDVMDFLDSILNEGGPLEEQAPEVLPDNGNELIGGTTNPAPVLSNPWASDGKSRASAYGISFDEDDASSSDGTETGSDDQANQEHNVNIPFLTPAAILNAEPEKDGEEEDGAVSMSFYTGLVDD